MIQWDMGTRITQTSLGTVALAVWQCTVWHRHVVSDHSVSPGVTATATATKQ
jgi:hypothetical protein